MVKSSVAELTVVFRRDIEKDHLNVYAEQKRVGIITYDFDKGASFYPDPEYKLGLTSWMLSQISVTLIKLNNT